MRARRALFLCCLLLLGAVSFGQARYRVLMDKKRIGTASISQKLLATGEKQVQLTLEMAGPGGKSVSVREEARYDAKGVPVRIFLETVATKPASRTQVTATFDKHGASATIDDSGARSVKAVPLIETGPRGDMSQFWFIRDLPKAGATSKYYRFDAHALEWTLTTATYVGPRSITIGGKKMAGFEIRDDRTVSIVDEKGLPLRIEIGGIVLERET